MRYLTHGLQVLLVALGGIALILANEKSPYDPAAEQHYDRANQLKSEGRLAEAEREFLLALEIDPKFDHASYNLGNLYFVQKRYADAIRAYESLVDMNPGFKAAYYNLGLAFKFSTQSEQAVVAFGDAILVGNNKRIVDSLSQIKKLLPSLPHADTSSLPQSGSAGLLRTVTVHYRWKNAVYGRPYFLSLSAPDLWLLVAERGKNVVVGRDEVADADLIARLRSASRLWRHSDLKWDIGKAETLLRDGRLQVADGSIVVSSEVNPAAVQFTIDVVEKYWEYKNSESERWDYHLLYKYDAKVKAQAARRKAAGTAAADWPKIMEESNVEQESLTRLLELIERLGSQVSESGQRS